MTRTQNSPTLGEWAALYEAADALKQQKPWEWMTEQDVFGVYSKIDQVTYYCAIMGNEGDHFGLVAYRGLQSFIGCMGEEDSDEDDILYLQNCLQCSFENRGLLEFEDIDIIKKLDLKFRGKHQWPVFRDYAPGMFPWFLDGGMCQTLTILLQQAVFVAEECREKGSEWLERKDFWVRRLGEDGKWTGAYESGDFSPEIPALFRLKDEVLLQKLRKLPVKKNFTLEVDVFYSPTPVSDGERPYYPKVCVFLDREQGMVMSAEMASSSEDPGYGFLESMLRLLREQNSLPAAIYVQREEAALLIGGICDQLRISVSRVRKLKFMEEFRHGLEKRFR